MPRMSPDRLRELKLDPNVWSVARTGQPSEKKPDPMAIKQRALRVAKWARRMSNGE